MNRDLRCVILCIICILLAIPLACRRNQSGMPQIPEATSTGQAGGGTQSVSGQAASQQDCTNSMEFIADVSIPDGSSMAAGTTFIKTWRIQNSGDCFWSNYTLQFDSGEPMGSMQQPIPDTPAGEELDLSIEMTAPGGAGSYSGYWSVVTSQGDSLGRLSCVITVPSSGADAEGQAVQAAASSLPAAPGNFAVAAWDTETYRVTWSDNSDNEDGFRISKVGIGWLKNPTGPNATESQIHFPPCGQSQDYHVVAFNAAGNSEPSNTLTLNGPACP